MPNLLRLIGFVSTLVGLIAFSGCTSQPSKPIPRGQNITRTADELRVVRESLEKLQEGTGTGGLSVPGANGQPVSLFLTDDEAALLKAAYRRRALERDARLLCPVCDVAYQTWRPASAKDRAPPCDSEYAGAK